MIMTVVLTDLKIAGVQRSNGSGHDETDGYNSLNMQFRTVYCIFSETLCLLPSDYIWMIIRIQI